MDINNLKYIVGQVAAAKPAVIRFFGPVNRETVEQFNAEFLWLQDYIQPSKIIVMINSEGGSVVYGMSTFSIIQSCPIDVDCVIEGIAASMGSVIWAAGKRLFMHDYSILMIHNPFCACGEDMDDNTKTMVNAFRGQLETIYCKRFGMKKEDVQKIMDGEENIDGTYLNAKDAVRQGIISKDRVIKTTQAVRDSIEAKIHDVTNATMVRQIMASAIGKDSDKLAIEATAILEKHNKESINHDKMEKTESTPMYAAVLAQLGLAEGTQLTSVSGRLNELLKAEAELKDVKSQFDALKIKFAGKETEVTNLTEKLNIAEGELKVYKDAEATARKNEINALIDKAIADGRIKADVKAQWVKMAETDLETVKNTLESIPVRDKVTEKIATDTENVEAAKNDKTPAEQELQKKIEAAIGTDFQFRTLDD